jgi:hypothetical protein
MTRVQYLTAKPLLTPETTCQPAYELLAVAIAWIEAAVPLLEYLRDQKNVRHVRDAETLHTLLSGWPQGDSP